LDLGHSLELEHKTPVTELDRYIKRYLDLVHLFSVLFVQNWLFWESFRKNIELFGDFLDEITLKTAIFSKKNLP